MFRDEDEQKDGTFTAVDGRIVPWACTTSNGTTGSVAIAGQQFELGKGGFFLISLKANQTKVEQLAVDMSKLQRFRRAAGEERMVALGDMEPRIKAFLEECRSRK